jgi:flavin reductase (DIM6/NTAB) family NADH-FMN oxidoreductase RutF
MSPGEIHQDHPFSTPPELRDPVRRFRGRLASPVTLVTSGTAEHRTGLTVSSLMVAEGSPAYLHLLIGRATELWDQIQDTGSFVVHILSHRDRSLADRFAMVQPSPGGLFAGLEVVDTDFGPELAVIESRAYCRYAGYFETTYHALVHGVVEAVVLGDLKHPLQYFRGEYFYG